MSSIALETMKLSPSAKLYFYEADLSLQGGPSYYWHNDANAQGTPIVWQGQTYQYLPIVAAGFEVRGDGPRSRPTVTVGDVAGALGAVVRAYRNLAGCRLYRRVTHVRFLDAVNFSGGNDEADPDAHYEDEIWIFDRIPGRDGSAVQWELCSPIDWEGLVLPNRQVRNTICTWRYRSADCGYTGPAVAKSDDSPTSSMSLDQCSLRISGCKKRFGAHAELPIGIFPGAGVIRAS